MNRRSHGLRAWLWQRVSAIYMTVFLLVFGGYLMLSPPGSWQAWRELVANPAINLGTGLFFAALLIHAWVGGRDVVLDYVHPIGLRLGMLGLLGLGLAASGLWVLNTLFSLN